MAWRCSGNTNAELIENLFEKGLIKSSKVKEAMINVDRADYCPNLSSAYGDYPQSIGHSATISAPHMHASAVESLLPFLTPISSVLDIGSGSGYLTAVFAELVCPSPLGPASESGSGKGAADANNSSAKAAQGRVVAVDHIRELRDLGEENYGKRERGRELLREGKVRFVVGDGRKGWVDEHGGRGGQQELLWDAIHVGAAASEVHEHLIKQLKMPGRMFIPVEDERGDQHIWVVDKDEAGTVSMKKLYGVRYVPLTDAPTSQV